MLLYRTKHVLGDGCYRPRTLQRAPPYTHGGDSANIAPPPAYTKEPHPTIVTPKQSCLSRQQPRKPTNRKTSLALSLISVSRSARCSGAKSCRATAATRGALTTTRQGLSSDISLPHGLWTPPPPCPASINLASLFPNTPLNYFVGPFVPFKPSVVAPSPDATPAPATAEEEEAPLFALAAAASPSSFENSRSGSPAPEISSKLHLKSNTLDSTTLNIWSGSTFHKFGAG